PIQSNDPIRARHEIAEVAASARAPARRRGVPREDAEQPGAALEVVIDEAGREAGFPDLHPVVDRRRDVAGGAGPALGGPGRDRRLVATKRLVVGLRPAPEDARERMARGAHVPRTNPAALVELDR